MHTDRQEQGALLDVVRAARALLAELDSREGRARMRPIYDLRAALAVLDSQP